MTHPGYAAADVEQALSAVRLACSALPEVTERLSHGSPSFFVAAKKTFVMFLDDHHGDGRLAIWCAAPPGVQEDMVDTEPSRFFRPPYVGHRGWLGVQLLELAGEELSAVVLDAYRTVAPKRLLAVLEAGQPTVDG